MGLIPISRAYNATKRQKNGVSGCFWCQQWTCPVRIRKRLLAVSPSLKRWQPAVTSASEISLDTRSLLEIKNVQNSSIWMPQIFTFNKFEVFLRVTGNLLWNRWCIPVIVLSDLWWFLDSSTPPMWQTWHKLDNFKFCVLNQFVWHED